MATRALFLDSPYGAYLHRDIPEEDVEVTHVGPGTPCGEWMRRFWTPFIVSSELKDLPVRVRLLGEDLVTFRDRAGNVGLLELHCTHRGTSLEYGQIEDDGVRCCYHGWLFGTNGRILETPGEPADSTLKNRLCHGAYPVQEHGGLVFAYMGPIDKRPAFPFYDTFDVPGTRLAILPTIEIPCNWLQVKENSMDPAHLYFLHTTISGVQFKGDLAIKSEMDFMETPRGMVYIDSRRLEGDAWVRMSDYIPPYIHQFLLNPPGERVPVAHGERTHWHVPIDDTHTKVIGLIRLNEGEEPPTTAGFGQTADRPYEERQRVPGDYDAQVTQRPIARHALEHLAVTDRGIIMLRNIVRRGIRAVQNGEEPETLYVKEGEPVPTYSSSKVFPLPPAPTVEEDRVRLREAGRKVAEETVKTRTVNGSC